MHQIENCPVCEGGIHEHYLACKDYTVSKAVFNIVTCKSCGFKFTNPIPKIEELGNYYKSEDYISHSNTKKGLVSSAYHLVRNYTIGKKQKLINKYVSRGTVLDYGCGTGAFLSSFNKSNWKSYGIEPDLGALKIAESLGNKVFQTKEQFMSQEPAIKFDVITLWHVLEHVVDLKSTIQFLKERLNPNGILIIALPNYRSHDAKHYAEYWAAYDVPRHLYHFDKDKISQLLGQIQFKLNETRPMVFDSYYVSLLSEKYKFGRNRYLNAVITGFISNLKALKSKEYSSLIYIFKAD